MAQSKLQALNQIYNDVADKEDMLAQSLQTNFKGIETIVDTVLNTAGLTDDDKITQVKNRVFSAYAITLSRAECADLLSQASALQQAASNRTSVNQMTYAQQQSYQRTGIKPNIEQKFQALAAIKASGAVADTEIKKMANNIARQRSNKFRNISKEEGGYMVVVRNLVSDKQIQDQLNGLINNNSTQIVNLLNALAVVRLNSKNIAIGKGYFRSITQADKQNYSNSIIRAVKYIIRLIKSYGRLKNIQPQKYTDDYLKRRQELNQSANVGQPSKILNKIAYRLAKYNTTNANTINTMVSASIDKGQQVSKQNILSKVANSSNVINNYNRDKAEEYSNVHKKFKQDFGNEVELSTQALALIRQYNL